jgi:predicted RNase H-like nuclease
MKLVYPPVGKMFYEGARRLFKAKVSVLPCRELPDEVCMRRYAVEGYPALVARYCLESRSASSRQAFAYKADDPRKDSPEKRAARQTIVNHLFQPELALALKKRYGVSVVWACEAEIETALVNPCAADGLDAVLCCLQAAYSYCQGVDASYGIPDGVSPHEGWIVDPSVSSPGLSK